MFWFVVNRICTVSSVKEHLPNPTSGLLAAHIWYSNNMKARRISNQIDLPDTAFELSGPKMNVKQDAIIKLLSDWRSISILLLATILIGANPAAAEELAVESRANAKKPNIIYVMLDDAGYADFGAFGSKDIQTPTFDQLCREGMRFTHHYSGSAVCAPTRCVLMTGLHSGHCKRRDNKATAHQDEIDNGLVFLDKTDLTIAKAMQNAGYVTGGIGKWGLGNPGSTGSPDKQGFDHFYGYLDQVHAHNHYTDWLWEDGKRSEILGNANKKEQTYVHDLLEDKTMDFIQKYADGDKPFFLYLPYTLPHGKYVIPHSDSAYQIYANKNWTQQVKNYAGMVTRADQTVGKMMELLKELKIDQDTIVFYTSDNGPNIEFAKAIGSGGPFRGTKRQLTEGGLRAAMVARWPGKIPADKSSEFAWSMVDMFPTCLELAGSSNLPNHLDGVSVLPTLMGAHQKPLEHIYFEIHHPFQQSVRIGDFKGFRTGTEQPLELFNVVNDPSETKNIATKRSNRLPVLPDS